MNTFEPHSDLIQEEECDTLILYVPEFEKEQLRVQLGKTGLLKISGTRPGGGNKWISFQKESQVSPNCDTSKISAKFEDGILYIRQPKLIVPAKKEEIILPPQEAPQPQKTTEEESLTKSVHETKQNPSTGVSEKSMNEDKTSVKKNNQEDETSVKKNDQEDASRASSSERKNVPENLNSGFVNKGVIQNGKTILDGDNKLSEGSPVTKLKKAKKMMNMVLVVLVVFGIGMFVTNSIRRSTSNEPKI